MAKLTILLLALIVGIAAAAVLPDKHIDHVNDGSELVYQQPYAFVQQPAVLQYPNYLNQPVYVTRTPAAHAIAIIHFFYCCMLLLPPIFCVCVIIV
jgi:hypothetical protein